MYNSTKDDETGYKDDATYKLYVLYMRRASLQMTARSLHREVQNDNERNQGAFDERRQTTSWIGRLNTVETSPFSKCIWVFITIPIKTQQDLCVCGNQQVVLKIYMEK